MKFYKNVFFLIYFMIIALLALIIYYFYKKNYHQKMILHKIDSFEHFIHNIQNKKYQIDEKIIQYFMKVYYDLV
jgi:hypothetical protein